ncbi:helix-turn-helix transcriptional regulator [Methylocella sp.]|uniref:helix-turn-helix transcriptional regulator n=1 Tax=Methylocella sp. TaxID=1978226 RepID=UPI003783A9F8
MRIFDIDFLSRRLQQAALDPAEWPLALDDVSRAAGGAGAVLFSLSSRLPGPLGSPDLDEMTADYIKGGWYERDDRYVAVPAILQNGVGVDQDFTNADDIRRSPYYQDFLAKHGRRWFAGLGFRTEGDGWVLSIQRTIAQGPFLREETQQLKALLKPLAEAATLAKKLAFSRVAGLADALELIGQPCIVFDERGCVLTINALADGLVDALIDVRTRMLSLGDPRSQARFDFLLKAAAQGMTHPSTPAVAAVRDRYGARHVVRAIALHGWARYPFTGARALALFEARRPTGEATQAALRAAFGLTPAEARLALALVDAGSLKEAARRNHVTYETARTYLKAIFLKTGMRRQAELAALIARCLV